MLPTGDLFAHVLTVGDLFPTGDLLPLQYSPAHTCRNCEDFAPAPPLVPIENMPGHEEEVDAVESTSLALSSGIA
jgi:hypothetical protein